MQTLPGPGLEPVSSDLSDQSQTKEIADINHWTAHFKTGTPWRFDPNTASLKGFSNKATYNIPRYIAEQPRKHAEIRPRFVGCLSSKAGLTFEKDGARM